jgi:LPS-assembly lipoprotein
VRVLIKKIFIVVFAFYLTACGFHLRGALDLPAGLKDVYLDGGSDMFRDQFKRVMETSSVQLANSPEHAGLIVHIFNEDNRRQILSLSSGGAANEFELGYNVQFEVLDSHSKVLLPRESMDVKRDYFNNQQAIIAKDNEEMTIRGEMYQQAVRGIVSRIRVVLESSAHK